MNAVDALRADRWRHGVLDWGRRRSQWLLLGLALVLGGLGAYGARGYIAGQLQTERERLQPRLPMTAVVVPKRDLARGEVIDTPMLAIREIPRTYLAPGSLTPDRVDEFVGARLTVPVRAGEPLLQAVLEGADAGTFAAKVPSGVRAFTVMVDEVNSLSGMLQPGDRIDLLLSARPPASAQHPAPAEVTRTLLQDVKVLATGRQVRPGGDEKAARGYGAITVEVTPEHAARLVVAQRHGRLSAILRNPRDRESASVAPVDLYDLLGMASPHAPTRAASAPARSTELIVGGQGALKPRWSEPVPPPSVPVPSAVSPVAPSPVAPDASAASIAGAPSIPIAR